MQKKILIVDDAIINRQLLKKMLHKDYKVLEAASGENALDILNKKSAEVSAVLLDISMPGIDGYEVLKQIRSNAKIAHLPVIMITGNEDEKARVKSLALGASDFIKKPYRIEVIRHCLKNNIAFQEAKATVDAIQRDKLTGLYSREGFFDKVREMVAEQKPGYYIMACFDINKFKIINDQYGIQKGDEVLQHVADTFREGFEPYGGICCRVSADNFAVLYPETFRYSEEIKAIRNRAAHVEGLILPIKFSIGRYLIDDVTMSTSAMYERAILAANSIKGRYDKTVEVYSETMRQKILREQEIVMEMEEALQDRQFEPWFQPQYNHSTDSMIGSEALVRWRHPQKGLIPPNDFIPIFEQNGFIYSLDKFVWEEVCKYLRKWTDEERSPLPVSVNISRIDLLQPDIIDVITGLVKKYNLQTDMLRLEITESAFSDSNSFKHIVNVVGDLIKRGFIVEIDDFGSGYSSLNTLKDVPAQILKLDMKFLESSGDSERGGNIVESVVRMAKWLGMSVIAEGVEKLEQANYLRSIGCNYIQGYLYAKPMPVAKYEEFCNGNEKDERLLTIETVENLDNNLFWDPESMDTLIFNSYVGGACIYEYNRGRIELIRATEKYAQVIGSAGMTVEDALKLDWTEHLDEKNRKKVTEDIERSIVTKDEIVGEYVFLDLPGCPHETYLRSTMRVIASAGKRCLVYCTNENITEQIKSEKKNRRLSEQMQSIMENVDLGIIAAALEDGDAKYLFANDQYYEMLGYTEEQFKEEIKSPYMTVVAEDRQKVIDETSRINKTGESTAIVYDIIRRDGNRRTLRAAISIGSFYGAEGPVQLSIVRDITEEVKTEQREREAAERMQTMMDDIPGGFVRQKVMPDGKLKPIYFNKGFLKLLGMDQDELMQRYKNDTLGGVHPDDIGTVKAAIVKMFEDGEAYSSRYRLRRKDGSYIWMSIFGRVTKDASETKFLNVYYMDASEQVKAEETQKELMDNLPGGAGIYEYNDGKLSVKFLNTSYWNLVGRTESGYKDMQPMSALHPDDLDTVTHELLAAVKQMRDMICDIRLRHETDGYIPFHMIGRIVQAKRGGYYIYTVFTPLDREHKSYQQILSQTLSAIMDSTTDLSFTKDKDYHYLTSSRTFANMVGQDSQSDVIGKTDYDLFEKEMADKFRSDDEALLASGESMIDMVELIPSDDGTPRYSSTSKYILRDSTGEVIGLYGVGRDVTEEKKLMEQLRISQEESDLAVQLGKTVVCRYNIADKTLTMAADIAAVYSLPEKIGDVPYGPVRLGLISKDSADAYIGFFEAILHGSEAATATFRQKYLDGEWRWLEANSSTIFSEDGAPVKAVVSFFDVTERLEKENIYKRWQQSLADRDPRSYTMFRCNLNNDASYAIAEGTMLTFDFDNAGRNFNERAKAYIKECVFKEDKAKYTSFVNSDRMLANYYRGKRSGMLEYREMISKENYRWIRLTIDLVEYPDSNEVEAYLMYEDIDEAKKAQLHTKELSETDPLTGVLNRTTFAAKVERIIRDSQPGMRHALLMLDIDCFKQVNDVFGHAAGDQTLAEIADGLKTMMRHDDLVARIGGDEFMVFLSGILDDNSAAAKAKQICALTYRAFSMEVQISGSVGIVSVPRDGTDFATLYKKADAALYYVKGSGKGAHAFYKESMEDEHLEPEIDTVADTNANEDPADGSVTQRKEKKRRMLIVDDSNIDYKLLQNIFKDEFIIEKAKDGNSALIRLRHYGSAISVVLLDLMMPGMNGFAVLEQMQGNAALQSIPVIIVSGDESRDTCLKAIRDGASDFVTKPVDPNILKVRVRSAVSKAENERLRAKNCLLEVKNEERIRYESALESTGVTFAEYNWHTGVFDYYPSISDYLKGTYDERNLWQILLSDMVAETQTVKDMQQLVHRVAEDKARESGSTVVCLKTPHDVKHNFRMNVRKLTNEYHLTNKLIIAFNDLDYDPEQARTPSSAKS